MKSLITFTRSQRLLLTISVIVMLFWLPGYTVEAETVGGIVCEQVEYACWGRSVPIKKVRCDEVYEKEVCDSDGGECGDCGCPDDDPLTTGNESDCNCCCTKYSCNLCLEGRTFPYPERPEGGHGSADKCPTDDDLGQKDGTGMTEDARSGYPAFDYDTDRTINVMPIQFGEVTPIPTPTATPPWTPFPTPDDDPDVDLTPTIVEQMTPTPTVTPTGPVPTEGWPTHTPTPITPSPTPVPVPTGTPTPPINPNAPCGWPVAESASRRVSGVCGISGDSPDDATESSSWLHEFNGESYEAIDVATGHLGASEQPVVLSTMDGYAYRCINTLATGSGSYGAYVIVTEQEGSFSGYATLYAHLSAETGDVEPGDEGCQTAEGICQSGDCLVSEGPVSRGDAIGVVGLTGPVTGYHSHYEVWNGGRWNRLCPADFMDYSAYACGGDQSGVFQFFNNIFSNVTEWINGLLQVINPFGDNSIFALNQ